MFKKIKEALDISLQFRQEDKINEGIQFLNEKLIEFPESSELAVMKTEFLQLSEEENLYELDRDIGDVLKSVYALNPKNFDALLETVAFEHLVMSNEVDSEIYFEKGLEETKQFLDEFLGLYFDYLIEIGKSEQIECIKNSLITKISNIPNEYNI